VDTIGKLKPEVVGLNEVCENDLRAVLENVKEKYDVEYHMQFKGWDSKPYCIGPGVLMCRATAMRSSRSTP
jgi:hypothetical protein